MDCPAFAIVLVLTMAGNYLVNSQALDRLTCHTGICADGDMDIPCVGSTFHPVTCSPGQDVCVSLTFLRVNRETKARVGAVRMESCGTYTAMATSIGKGQCVKVPADKAATAVNFAKGGVPDTSVFEQVEVCGCRQSFCNNGWRRERFNRFTDPKLTGDAAITRLAGWTVIGLMAAGQFLAFSLF